MIQRLGLRVLHQGTRAQGTGFRVYVSGLVLRFKVWSKSFTRKDFIPISCNSQGKHELSSKLLKGGYIGNSLGDYCSGY